MPLKRWRGGGGGSASDVTGERNQCPMLGMHTGNKGLVRRDDLIREERSREERNQCTKLGIHKGIKR